MPALPAPVRPLRAMNIQIAGLASNFDWKSFVDQIISLEGAGANRMRTEQTTNNNRASALSTLNTRLETLRTAANDLSATTAFSGRTARLANASTSSWSTSASASAAAGNYALNVSTLATSARLRGATDISAGLAPTNNVSGLTLGTLDTVVPPTAGTFTVNGAQVTITLADSLQDVFDRISTATGGNVTAAYDSGTDRVSLTASSGSVVLGAANDTSNFLTAMRLANNGSGIVASSGALGAADLAAPLNSGRLRANVTAVDGAGAGSFALNGVNIAYNVNTDSLSSVIARINASTAGVAASYDAAGDRMILTNTATGDLGVAVSEADGGLLGALGLTTLAGSSLQRGTNATFTVNGGDTLTSTSNTLTAAAHGITGLSVTATTTGVDTVTVASDTAGMRAKVEAFVKAFNDTQTYIDAQSRVTSANGRVTAGVLASNREVQNWASTLRQQVFSAVPGLSGTIARLSDLGVEFSGVEAQLSIRDSAKLDRALADRPAEVADFFGKASTGFGTRLDSYVDSLLGITGTGSDNGLLGRQRTGLTKANESLDAQIEALQRQLTQRRSILESSFIAMETAQSRITQMQQQLNSALGTTSSSGR
jgi:flagellar hook-associated protein 2